MKTALLRILTLSFSYNGNYYTPYTFLCVFLITWYQPWIGFEVVFNVEKLMALLLCMGIQVLNLVDIFSLHAAWKKKTMFCTFSFYLKLFPTTVTSIAVSKISNNISMDPMMTFLVYTSCYTGQL